MSNKAQEKFDVLVLGAGIIGVSTAWHLQRKGKKVALIDRGEPGSGTSFGNAGLIERSSVIPYCFPRRLCELVRYGLNHQAAMRYNWLYLPRIVPWLYQFWRHSAPFRLEQAARDMVTLIERSLDEHNVMIEAANLHDLRRCQGWIEIFRTARDFTQAQQELAKLHPYQLEAEILDAVSLRQREPALKDKLAGAIHWLDPHTITAPGQLVAGYCQHFIAQGGSFIKANAEEVTYEGESGWQLMMAGQILQAKELVVALGWESAAWLEKFTPYKVALGAKRGYHMHYALPQQQMIHHPLCDTRGGFVLAPMRGGLRLTTGIEFNFPSAPPNEIQLRRAEKIARHYYPLGRRLDGEIWLGHRPCLPDMRPIISKLRDMSGLWANFGHAHHGLTLGPVSGRLLAEMMVGERPCVAPHVFSIERF